MWGAVIAGGAKLLGMAGAAVGIGGLVTGVVNADQKFFGGHITGFVGSAIEGVTRALGKHQQTAVKDVELFTFGKHLDNWGKGLATFLDNTPFKFISDALRNWGQDMMGVAPIERQFGTATTSQHNRAAAGLPTPTAPASGPNATVASLNADTPAAPTLASSRVPSINSREAFTTVADNNASPIMSAFQRNDYFTPAPETARRLFTPEASPAPAVAAFENVLS